MGVGDHLTFLSERGIMTLKVESVKISELAKFEGNARKGNVSLIAESLQKNGQFKPIVVNKGTQTGKMNEVLAGNHTLAAAESLGWEKIDAVFVDVDRDAALRIVLADNRSNDVASYDNDALLSLLHELPDLDGTGYSSKDLDELLGDLMDIEDDEPENTREQNFGEQYEVVIECENEFQQQDLLIKLSSEGLKVRAIVV